MSRADLTRRHEQFTDVSPQVGELDSGALERALREDPAAAMDLLADLTVATDESLREQVRRVAARLILDVARTGRSQRRGTRRLRPVPADTGGDLDIDLSIDAIAAARAEQRPPALDELLARDWGRPELALCLLVDASGSMSGARLATAAVTAAACSWRAPGEYAVLSFARSVTTHRGLTGSTSAAEVVNRLLTLRGHGLTAVASALRAASDRLATARAQRRVTVLLSDCRATDGENPVPAAAAQDELLVLAPADDGAEAAQLAREANARFAALGSAADAPAALARLLDMGR